MKVSVKVFSIVAIIVMISGCAQGCDSTSEPSGFWVGLAHGLTCVISLIVKIFNPDFMVYSLNNSGLWYDLGFLMGAGALVSTVKK